MVLSSDKSRFRYSINPSNVLALRMVYSYYDDEASNIQFDYNKNIIKNVAATFTAKYNGKIIKTIQILLLL